VQETQRPIQLLEIWYFIKVFYPYIFIQIPNIDFAFVFLTKTKGERITKVDLFQLSNQRFRMDKESMGVLSKRRQEGKATHLGRL
jgi:hypothetical protein